MKYIIMVTLALFLTSCGFDTIGEGERGFKTTLGKATGGVLEPGLHFYNPFTSDMVKMQVREQKWETEAHTLTKDAQNVSITFVANYRPESGAIIGIYRQVGNIEDLELKLLKPALMGAIQDEVGKVVANDLVEKREVIARATLNKVKDVLDQNNIILSSLMFNNIEFAKDYQRAVEEKVVAEQRHLKSINDTKRIQEEARQQIETAKAEAESMKIKTSALSQNKSLVEYEKVMKWDGKLPNIMMGGGATPLLNMKDLMQ